MKAPFFILLIGSICLALVQSAVPRYTCPPPGGEPVEVIGAHSLLVIFLMTICPADNKQCFI